MPDIEAHTLVSGGARASIALRGAELRSWSIAGRDLLWSPDSQVWDAVAPILFPVVGWTRNGAMRVDGQRYPLGLHGFASSRRFVVAEKSDDRLRLIDRADADTLAVYPFTYRLEIAFELGETSLRCQARVRNEDTRPMPYAVGFHPGFRWPGNAPAHVMFDTAEETLVPVITSDGLFARDRRPVALEGRRLAITPDAMAREALCFLDARSRGLTYEADGFGRLRIEHDGFPHIALWSRPSAPFLCIESWTGHGDPQGFDGELSDKPSMRLLQPGDTAQHAATYTSTPP